MAPQHRRGGKHAVKDKDLTHTKYDDYNREQLLAAVKDAGCYAKDDKKSIMARKLAEHDRNKQIEASRFARERRERETARQEEIAHAVQAQRDRRYERAKRNEERGTRYERGEEVSSNSSDTASDQSQCAAHRLTVTGGLAISDETWEDTCSETTIRSENPPVRPASRLQLFEWPYSRPPSSSQPLDSRDKQHPAPLPFAPLKLAATITHDRLTLPGKSYPAGVDPAYVPNLDARTRAAARHGHLLNQLSRAVIEPASVWASRTIVQGWNGIMYFSLPATSQHETRQNSTLAEVYCKHHAAHQRLLHSTPGETHAKADRDARFKQIATIERRRVADVYEASLWKPAALGYLPAYLDWETGMRDDTVADRHKTIENLWYVRFPGCDVPHYYFWSRGDPTTSDPGWSVDTRHSTSKMRVKRLTAPPQMSLSAQPMGFEDTLAYIERYLTRFGLEATFAKFRKQAFAAGRQRAWTKSLAEPLIRAFPSGAVPSAPPVNAVGRLCVAGMIMAVLDDQDLLPYTGEERWTRDDDGVWDVVSVAGLGDDGASEASDSGRTLNQADERAGQALYRRESLHVLPLRTSPVKGENTHIWMWLDSLASTFPASNTPLSADVLSLDEPISPANLETPQTTPTCPFCSLSWLAVPEWAKAAHMLSHSHVSSRALTSTYTKDVSGQGVKRRHSVLSQRTLQTYALKCGRGRKMARVDSARSVAGSLAGSIVERVRDRVVEPIVVEVQKAQRERSPFSKERRRARAMRGLQVGCGEGRGGRGWVLERAQSVCGLDIEDESDVDERAEDTDDGREANDERDA